MVTLTMPRTKTPTPVTTIKMMKAILFKLTFLFSLFLTTLTMGQTIAGDYGNEPFYEEIYLNGLALKPDNNFSQDELNC